MNACLSVGLRPVVEDDLPALFEFQCDPLSNELAATYPRSASDFDSFWIAILCNPTIIARSVLVDGGIAGSISCFKTDGCTMVGYWIGRSYWGRGVATRALELLLREVEYRPLHAVIATTNGTSFRVLQKCGFKVVEHRDSPETERYRACEEAVLILGAVTD